MINSIGGCAMGFDQEWAQLRDEAAARQATSMRLNQLPADPGGGGGVAGPGGILESSPAEKRAAANTIDNSLVKQTTDATNWADEATTGAIGSLKGWETAAGLKTVESTWDKQVKTLIGRLHHESRALRSTVVTLGGVDSGRGQRINSVPSSFNSY
ncbi:hypothetical protein ACIRNI_23280 [Streptomyces sp. NPDC093546]|uniref:hypothetical protein n=1 Tax=Streptomyces sp. NPDC093546 TaxID=3366040 RepID=UPI00380DD25C